MNPSRFSSDQSLAVLVDREKPLVLKIWWFSWVADGSEGECASADSGPGAGPAGFTETHLLKEASHVC